MTNIISIGVDPAFRAGGFHACVIDYTDRTVRFLEFADVLHWHDWLRSDDAPDKSLNRVFVVVENSNLQNINFDTTGNRAELQRKGRNVGTNQAASELAYRSAARHYGPVNVREISPRDKGAKLTDAEYMALVHQERLTAPNKSNQDQRDAFKLALKGPQLQKYGSLLQR